MTETSDSAEIDAAYDPWCIAHDCASSACRHEHPTESVATRLPLSDGSSWPLPDVADDGLSWRLRYGVRLSSAETMRAAQIIEAYSALLTEVGRPKRELVVREVRAHLSTRPGETT